MMEYVTSIFWIGLEMLSVILFCNAFLPPKPGKLKRSLGILLWGTIIFIYSNTPMIGIFKPLISIVVLVLLSLWVFSGKLIHHFILVLVCYIFIAIIDTFVVNGTCILLDISYNDLVWRKITYITVTTIDKLLTVLLMWIIWRAVSSHGLRKTNSKWIVLMLLFPATSIAMFAMLVYSSNQSGDLPINVVIFAGILAIANVAMLYIVSSLEKAARQEQEASMLKQQIALQAENYTTLRENYSTQRKATHEFKRHVQTLGDLLEHEEYLTAKHYLNQLQSNRKLEIFSISSKHPVFDVILNQKHQVAQEFAIKMHVQVNDLSLVTLQTDEIVVLLSNLLDNAIEACQRIETHREIYCNIVMEEYLNIVIRNTSPSVELIDGNIKTSKYNSSEHGYGLPAVKYILNKLGSEYTFDYKDGWFTFSAEVPLG